ncbi:MAG: hypothetical protein CEO22_102 [Candidatus Berkelbacteria bacterium Gr01-1014_85]|uniref:Uncharacterized protein n=1 Tax=Candidatus Berkelbacteria bacterium Gr01-1014_85 TaxID=2017150 RepID=A0A554JDG5_9BACT|nr:MAG: hypothetical protein CEO22_102 [Candidatus Berkelbacteria bacterium Gr01-1014_85]
MHHTVRVRFDYMWQQETGTPRAIRYVLSLMPSNSRIPISAFRANAGLILVVVRSENYRMTDTSWLGSGYIQLSEPDTVKVHIEAGNERESPEQLELIIEKNLKIALSFANDQTQPARSQSELFYA